MKRNKGWYATQRSLSFFVLFSLTSVSFSQNIDSTKVVSHFGGAVTVTNKGISLIPNLTLGEPAAIFDLAVGKKRISFEPQFTMNIGGHPAFAFKTLVSDFIFRISGSQKSFI